MADVIVDPDKFVTVGKFLEPANAQMAPILVRASDFKPTMLLGIVVGVYRKL